MSSTVLSRRAWSSREARDAGTQGEKADPIPRTQVTSSIPLFTDPFQRPPHAKSIAPIATPINASPAPARPVGAPDFALALGVAALVVPLEEVTLLDTEMVVLETLEDRLDDATAEL